MTSMTPERYEQIRALFHSVCELDAPQCSAVLDEQCAHDPELRREVEELLQEENKFDPLLVESHIGAVMDLTHAVGTPSEVLPRTIGKYRLIRRIGEGGMGTVYEAEQDSPRRTVAMKVIRPGVVSPAMIRRFANEAQVLARLQHPGIAQIYDAGTAETDRGVQPYFVMELVRGIPLLQYADSTHPSVAERLELISKIADAVHHAHTKGVVHRDLKPGNILVEDSSGAPLPKILDFGVARTTDSDVRSTTLHTDMGQLIGTVPYMSPEQASGDSEQIDTRSDVYSLGVVCYELLTSRLPYDLGKARVHEAVRMIREEEPTRLSSISRVFRGDVETIVGKALEKDKERRYASAADLAADIRRHLNDEPIVARPASAMYQMRKFAKRNKALVGGAIAVLGVLIAGVATTSYWLMEALAQRDNAREAEDLAKERLFKMAQAREAADLERKKAQAVSDFLTEMLTSVRQAIRYGHDPTVRDIVDHAASRIDSEFGSQPALCAALHNVIAQSYYYLGQYPQAATHFDHTYQALLSLHGESHPDVLAVLYDIAMNTAEMGEPQRALEFFESVRVFRETKAGSADVETLKCVQHISEMHRRLGHLQESLASYEAGLDTAQRSLGDDHEVTIDFLSGVGNVLLDLGRSAEAKDVLARVLDQRKRVLGEDALATLDAATNLAILLSQMQEYDSANAQFEYVIPKLMSLRGETHDVTISATSFHAMNLAAQGNDLRAEQMLRAVAERTRQLLGLGDERTLWTMENLAGFLQQKGHYDEVEVLLEAIWTGRVKTLGEDHAESIRAHQNLGGLYLDTGQLEKAETAFRQSSELMIKAHGADNPIAMNAANNLATTLIRMKRFDEAIVVLDTLLSQRVRLLGPDHRDSIRTRARIGTTRLAAGDAVNAIESIQQALVAAQRLWPADDRELLALRRTCGECLTRLGRYGEAEAELNAGYTVLVAGDGAGSGDLKNKTIQALVELYDAWGNTEEASKYRAMLSPESASTKPTTAAPK